MRLLYTILLYLLTPFLLLRLYWKGRRLPAYRQRIKERFALGKTAEVDVWVHAVSLGEVMAATPLIDALLAKPWRVLVTTMTPTGSQRVLARFGAQVQHQYIPYDLPWALRRFFNKNKARVGIIMETELWPNVIYHAKRMKIPVLLANARLSDKAFKRYYRVRFFFKPFLNQLAGILAQSDHDAKRYLALGATGHLVSVCGNMKFDLQTQVLNQEAYRELKESWGVTRTVLMAASTHDNEEEQLLSCYAQLKTTVPDLLLLIAPRHPERFQTVFHLSQQQGFNTGLRSHPETINTQLEVVILDSIGELLGFYQVSDYAFVGGSLVPVGGHNVLEPIAMQVPVFSGHHVHNAKAIFHDLSKARAIQFIENANSLAKAVTRMHEDKKKRAQQVANANAILAANRGSVARHMEKVEAYLKRPDFAAL